MLTLDRIGPYLKLAPGSYDTVYPFYKDACEIAYQLRVHVDGSYAEKLIEITRPHETDKQLDYRKKNFTPITEPTVNGIVVSIRKISQADDFGFSYPDMPSRIPESENLKNYLEEDFPFDNSIRNWLFGVRIFDMLADPNGVIAVLPSNTPASDSEYLRPYPYYFPSERVIDFQEGQFAVLLSDQKSILTGQQTTNATGRIYYFLDTDSYLKATQVGDPKENRFELSGMLFSDQNSIASSLHFANGWLPAFKFGGGKVVQSKENGQRLHKSLISPCLTYLNQALQRQSDFLVQLVYHVHSEAWQYTTSKCGDCNGVGKKTIDNKPVTCPTCRGGKFVLAPTSPLGITTFTPDSAALPGQGGQTIQPPHKGYIEKPLPPTEFLKSQVQDDLMSALKALNMEYAKSVPLEQSGVAKGYDRQEVNNFYYEIGRHLVENIFRPVVYYIACMRYGQLLPESQLDDILPFIAVPRKFDIFSIDMLSDQIKKAVDNKMDAAIIFALQAEYASKEFGYDSIELKLVEIARLHDPMPFKSEDDRMTVLANGGCSKAEYVLSAQFNHFARMAMETDAAFFDLPYKGQKDGLYKMVEEQIKTIEPPAPIVPPIPAKPPVPVA